MDLILALDDLELDDRHGFREERFRGSLGLHGLGDLGGLYRSPFEAFAVDESSDSSSS